VKKIKVDTTQMFYNPLDDKGLQKLKVGDLVQVTRKLDVNLFAKNEIVAEHVTTLIRDTEKNKIITLPRPQYQSCAGHRLS
jgi:hypothetical protein